MTHNKKAITFPLVYSSSSVFDNDDDNGSHDDDRGDADADDGDPDHAELGPLVGGEHVIDCGRIAD